MAMFSEDILGRFTLALLLHRFVRFDTRLGRVLGLSIPVAMSTIGPRLTFRRLC